MTKITLEDAAFSCDRRGASQEKKRQAAEAKGLNNETFNHRTTRNKWQRHAALCRSAQRVIEAAKEVSSIPDKADAMYWVKYLNLSNALAAHAKNEQGTGE